MASGISLIGDRNWMRAIAIDNRFVARFDPPFDRESRDTTHIIDESHGEIPVYAPPANCLPVERTAIAGVF